MQQMTLQARARLIGAELASFLRQFSTPNHLTDEALQVERVRATAEAINARIPTDFVEDSVRDRVGRAFRHILATHRGSGWPSVATFVEAMDAVAKDSKGGASVFSDVFGKDGKVDPMKVAAKRIRNGEPVADGYLYGRQARELVADYGIGKRQIIDVRDGLEREMRKTYGESAQAHIDNLHRRHEASA